MIQYFASGAVFCVVNIIIAIFDFHRTATFSHRYITGIDPEIASSLKMMSIFILGLVLVQTIIDTILLYHYYKKYQRERQLELVIRY